MLGQESPGLWGRISWPLNALVPVVLATVNVMSVLIHVEGCRKSQLQLNMTEQRYEAGRNLAGPISRCAYWDTCHAMGTGLVLTNHSIFCLLHPFHP